MAQGSIDDPVTSLLNDGTGVPVPLGQGTAATSLPMNIASDQPAVASKNAAASQVDGHSASMGTTTDADTANTVIGRLKQLVTKLAGGLPAALVGGRLDANFGSWLGSTAPTVGQKTGANSIPTIAASDQWPDALTRAIFFKQTDGTNIAPTGDVPARKSFVSITDGTLVAKLTPDSAQFVYPSLNEQLYHVNGIATTSGAATFGGYGASQVTLYINVKNAPTGTAPTLQYTLQEVDPGDNVTVIGPSISSSVITAIGIQRITLPLTLGGNIKVTQTVGGTTPSFTGLYVTLVSKSGGITLADLGGVNVAKIDALGGLSARLREDPVFEVAGTGIALGNNKSMLSIFNTDATVRLRVLAIWLINTQTAAVTGVLATFELRRLTGTAPSAGTDLTTTGVEQHDTLDAKNANWTVRTGATVGTEATKLLKRVIWSSDEYAAGAADVESADHAQQANIPIWERYDATAKPIVLRQNEGLTVKCATNSTVGTWDIFALVAQET